MQNPDTEVLQYPGDEFGDSPRGDMLAHLDGGTGGCPWSLDSLPSSMPDRAAIKSQRYGPRKRGSKKGPKPQQHRDLPQHPIGARPPLAPGNWQAAAEYRGRPEAPTVLPLCNLLSSKSQIEDNCAALTGGAFVPANSSVDACSRTRNQATPAPSMDILKAWPQDATTVMLKNIPNRYTAEEVLAEMLAGGFDGTFDFFYLPIDFKTKRNRGYSFINFRDAADARRFVEAFHGEHWTRYATQKILEVSPALTQGFEANITQYVRKDAQRIQNPWFRPMIFADGDDEAAATAAA